MAGGIQRPSGRGRQAGNFPEIKLDHYRIAVLLDGGFVRTLAKRAGKAYDPDLIEKVGLVCHGTGEEVQRILYYDCAPYAGTTTLPVSGDQYTFTGSDQWLHELGRKDLFAVRRGVLKFRGWIPKNVPITRTAAGLKIAIFARSSNRRVSTCESVWIWQIMPPTARSNSSPLRRTTPTASPR